MSSSILKNLYENCFYFSIDYEMKNSTHHILILWFLHLKEKQKLRVQETKMNVHVQATEVLFEFWLEIPLYRERRIKWVS